MDKKKSLLIIILLVVVGLIVALESQRVSPPSSLSDNESIAPELVGITLWHNSDPLTLEELRGKVVLIDFWTYSCINCIRTLPHLKTWYEAYADDGLVVIGVHTPEFSFEKKPVNVAAALAEFNITYPVAQDDDFATWHAFRNRYWPHEYLIDKDGVIRYDHIGEGGYEKTEEMIRLLLEERNGKAPTESSSPEVATVDFQKIQTPELYLGYGFDRGNLGNAEQRVPNEVTDYNLPEKLLANKVYLQGNWFNGPESVNLAEGGEVFLRYTAKTVSIVAGGSGSVDVFLDGEQVSSVTIDGQKLYTLVQGAEYVTHTLRFVPTGDFELFTFTFG